jgi:hypothetical protein
MTRRMIGLSECALSLSVSGWWQQRERPNREIIAVGSERLGLGGG